MFYRFLILLLFFICSASAVTVESRDEQLSNVSQTSLRIRLFNDSGDSLKNVELRYFLSKKKLPVQVEKYYPANLLAEMVSPDSGSPFLKISIPTIAPGVFPDSGAFRWGCILPIGATSKRRKISVILRRKISLPRGKLRFT